MSGVARLDCVKTGGSPLPTHLELLKRYKQGPSWIAHAPSLATGQRKRPKLMTHPSQQPTLVPLVAVPLTHSREQSLVRVLL
jgi:hypothetical protein